ncbi:MAG: SDR family oxidoreductase [Ferruginibacter sp.]
MILVTGATGHFGSAAIDFLLQKGIPANSIAALVRDETKAAGLKEKGIAVRKGDYDDYDSLVNAFSGVDKLLLVSGNDIVNRGKQQANAVKAAKEAGVKYILYTSFDRKNETASSPIAFLAKTHIETEQDIKASGIPYTIFRNTLYTDFLPIFIGEKVFDTGVYWPAGNGRASVVTRKDMAEAAANVLTGAGHEGKEYIIANPVSTSLQEVATALGKIAGKTITYISPSTAEYKAALTAAGVPETYVDIFASFGEAVEQGEFDNTHSDIEQLLGRKPETTAAFLERYYQK